MIGMAEPFLCEDIRLSRCRSRISLRQMRVKMDSILRYFLFVSFVLFFGVCSAAGQTPARIISLAPSLTEILYDLQLGGHVVAVSGYCDYPPEVRTKPKIGGMSNPSIEAIVAMKPDIVLLTEDGNPRAIQHRLKSLGVRTHVFRAKRLADLPGEIRSLGAALDCAEQAEHSARRIENALRSYAGKARPSIQRAPQKILFVVHPDPLIVAGSGTAIDDVLKLLGLINIAANAATQYPRYSIEEVIRQSPDVILIGKGHDATMAASRRLLKKLNRVEAVRLGRVYEIGDPLFRLGPRITEGIAEVAGLVAGGAKERLK